MTVLISGQSLKNEKSKAEKTLRLKDSFDNHEGMLSGTGTSHRVNLILVLNKKEEQNQQPEDVENEVCELPLKKKCNRSLPSDTVMRKIPKYYRGKRVGLGELPYVRNLGLRSSYDDKAKEQRMQFLVWVENSKLTHCSSYLVGQVSTLK